MTLPNAASLVATRLQAASMGTLGTDIFIGAEQPSISTGVPAAAIFCVATGGPAQDDFCGDAPHGINTQRVQVVVRGAAEDPETVFTKARNVWDALHLCTITNVLRCATQQSGPVDMGKNDQEQPRWSINLELWAQV